MTGVYRYAVVHQDCEELRGFVEQVLDDNSARARREQLVAVIDRLEALASRTIDRSGVGTVVHVQDSKFPLNVHCGRLAAVMNHSTEQKAHADPGDSSWCRRCVSLMITRKRGMKKQA